MNLLFRLTGVLASVATLLLTVLDILDRHTNVDTRALLADIGGDVGRLVAGLQDWLGGAVTWIAIQLSELFGAGGGPAAPVSCPPGAVCPRSAEEQAMSTGAQFYELGAQLVIIALALLVLIIVTRRRA